MTILGTLAVMASLTIVVFGFPHQIYKNYQKKNCEGLSPALIYTACAAYTLWSSYGWLKPDYFLAAAQTPGALCPWILFFQLLYYGKNNPRQ